jgi:hypothetical protein
MTNPIYKLIGYVIGVFVGNGIIMWVYNSILPEMYGFKPIGYWQLFGLYMICSYLFKTHNVNILNKDKN